MSDGTDDQQDGDPSNDLRADTEPAGRDEPPNEVDRWLKPDTPPAVVERFRQLHIVAVERSVSYAGPLPPASEFAKYEEAMPGAADRILSLAENEQSLRSRQSRNLTSLSKHRINAATVVSLAVIGLAGGAFYLGHSWESVPLGLGGLLTLFVRELASAFKSRKDSRVTRKRPPER
jgi:uncharacterized membrane protein